jgi:tetratricopeptide (TPR) repeat protein
MSSLSDLPEVVGFFSYSREDDDAFKGSLSALRDGIQRELSAQLGRTKRNFRLWQDQEGIAPGRLWESEIKTAVEQAVFFIPIVTPRAVNSENCQIEYGAFLERERKLDRTDLVFPILYIGVPALENEAQWRNHPVLSVVGKRQYVDWRQFRHQDIHTTAVREAIERFCGKIVEALNRPWLSPEERRQREEAEAQERLEVLRRQQEAEAEQAAGEAARRSKDEAEAQRIAEEQRQQQAEAERLAQEEKDRIRAVEAARLAEEETQRKKDEAEAQRIAEDTRRQQAEAQRIAEEQGQQQAEAKRLAEQKTQKKKAASEAAAPSEKEAPRRNLTIGAFGMIAVIVAIAIWFVNRAPFNNSPTATQICNYQGTAPNSAVAACTQLIALNPKDEIAYSNRCSSYIELGNYSAALADCNQAIALNPKDEIAYTNRCSAYIYLGNPNAAVADCNQAIALDPKLVTAYTNRCAANSRLGQYRAGLADCNQAIALDPNDGNAYFNRGFIHEKLGTNAGAIADFQQALTIDPSDQDSQNELKRLGASPAASGGR